jgi:hypothetical protein
MSYRDDASALHQRIDALERQASGAQKDLAEARRVLADLEARRRLPVLDNISIAAPCHADWDKMTGDARARFCGSCDKNVFNLSEMTRAEAEALIIEKQGKLCVRYYQRADGTILTADCPVGVTKRRRRRRIVATAAAAMSALAAAGAMFHRHPPVVMGAMEPVQQVELQLPSPDPDPTLVAKMGDIGPPVVPVMGEMAFSPPHQPKPPKPPHDQPRPKMGKIKIADSQ